VTVSHSIVVPCWNEAQNLPSLLARFRAERRPGFDTWELVLVDNGSTDETQTLLGELLRGDAAEFARAVRVPAPNVGYGHGIMTGLRAARGQWLAWTHADGQTPPRDVFAAFELLERSAAPERTFVKGRRRGRPLADRAFTFGMQVAAAAIVGENLSDINAQPKAFPRTLLDLAVAPPNDLSLDLYFYWLAVREGFDVRTFDVDFGAREHGESRWAFSLRSRARNVRRTLTFMRSLRDHS